MSKNLFCMTSAASPFSVGNTSTPSPVLEINDLAIGFGRENDAGLVVDGVSFTVSAGETVGVVGESGSGKSLTALSILGLLPQGGRQVRGTVQVAGQSVADLDARGLRRLRGGQVAMVFQDPMTSLNPVFTVGEQIAESVRLHRGLRGRAAWDASVEAMRQVHIADPARRARQYPHELSGGMRQRVMIALALASAPKLLLADEPTTALDATVQAQILALLGELREKTGMGVLFITHDLGVVAEVCDRVIVMYAGKIMEAASVRTLFARPAHPYTRALLHSLPEHLPSDAARLRFIPGQPPAPGALRDGCPFRTRCDRYLPGVCEKPLPTVNVQPGQTVRCHLYTAPGTPEFAHVSPGGSHEPA